MLNMAVQVEMYSLIPKVQPADADRLQLHESVNMFSQHCNYLPIDMRIAKICY